MSASTFETQFAEDDPRILQSINSAIDRITDKLYLGNRHARHSLPVTSGLVNIIVSILTGEERESCIAHMDPLPEEVVEHELWIDDTSTPRFARVLREGVRVLDEEITKGNTCVVHCMMGISRSASIVIGYLMFRHGLNAQHAYAIVERLRPCINPNANFIFHLKEYEQELIKGQHQGDR